MGFFNSKEKRKGAIVSILVHAVLILIFIFSGMKYLDPPPDEGSVTISFGHSEYGSHNKVETVSKVTSTVTPSNAIAQDIEESPVSSDEKKTEKQTTKPSEETSNVLSSFMNNKNSNDKGKGNDSDKYGFKGIESGSKSDSYSGGNSNGNYRLDGRKPLNKPQPKYDSDDQGTIIVKIIVDPKGNVIQADIELKGTTVNDPILWDRATKAAFETKWEENPNANQRSRGVIIYNFMIE